MENLEKTSYTYKEILLALREEVLKNEKLLKELEQLVSIEKNAGAYRFIDTLKFEAEPYKIILVIDEVQKRQSKLKMLFNKLTDYKFARASISKFQQYDVIENNGSYDFEMTYTYNLDADYFGKIEIIDLEKFADLINELSNSMLSQVTQQGIHINEDLFFEISHYPLILNGNNLIHYVSSLDVLRLELSDKTFDEMLSTEISSSLLSDEMIELINNYSGNKIDIEFQEDKKVSNNCYKVNEEGKKLVLTRKK